MNFRLTASTFLLCVLTAAANAAPTLHFSWDSCTGPVQKTPSGPGSYTLYVTATGMDVPHWAYEGWFWLANSEGAVPDAWEFDANGCQAGRIQFTSTPAAGEESSCPTLYGSERHLCISGARFNGGYPFPAEPGSLIFSFAAAYAYETGVVSDPNQRYLLYRVTFDMSGAVEGDTSEGACGGLDQTVWIRPVRSQCSYLDGPGGAGQDVPFDVPQEFVTFGGASATTPAATTTWGLIKGQYRR